MKTKNYRNKWIQGDVFDLISNNHLNDEYFYFYLFFVQGNTYQAGKLCEPVKQEYIWISSSEQGRFAVQVFW